MKRPCLDCGVLVATGTRCDPCRRGAQRRRDAWRGTAAQRGYNGEYLRNRAAILANGPHPCGWGCGREATTADHVVPLAHGGSNDTSNLIPCCADCNASRGSRTAPSGWTRARGAGR